MVNKITLLLLFLSIYSLSYSQNIDFLKKNFPNNKDGLNKAVDNIFDGDDFYTDGFYAKALKFYKKANDFNPNCAILNYKIGVCYLNSTNKAKAQKYFLKAYKLKPFVTNDILFKLAQSYQLTYKFDKAIEYYKKYLNNLIAKDISKQTIIVNKKIDECNTGKLLVKNPVKGKIINLKNINSKYAEYGAIINADESKIFFTSRRKGTTGNEVDPFDLKYYEDVYVATKNNNEWQEPLNIDKPLNTNKHDAVAGISEDAQTLFLYRNTKSSVGNIFISYLQGDKWSEPKEMPEPINSKYQESSACLSPDRNTLYFVSNRKGGLGGKDIYYSVKKDNKWSEPVNIKILNTKYDEDGLFIHPNGKTLYFSSKGHNTMGGFDIFMSEKNDKGEWSKPKNIGYPINTPDDDLYFVMSADAKHGYFTSNKDGGKGDKDIYLIDFTNSKSLQQNNYLTLLKGTITDAKTKKPIKAYIEITDNKKNKIISKLYSNEQSGEFMISLPAGKNYGISISADNYLFYSDNFTLPDSSRYKEITKNIDLLAMEKGAKTILKNIFFDYASDSLRKESYAELNRVVDLLKKYPKTKIEISGHTDNKSSLKTNKELSKARAKRIYDYLISKGIKSKRLTYKGYAFFYPIASNDTEDGRKQNRRVEIKILR